MKKILSTWEIARLVAQGIDPFGTVKRIERAPLYRRRKVYVYRRKKRHAGSKPNAGRSPRSPGSALSAVS